MTPSGIYQVVHDRARAAELPAIDRYTKATAVDVRGQASQPGADESAS